MNRSELLNGINPMLHGLGRSHIIASDYDMLWSLLEGHKAVSYVHRHRELLQSIGQLEPALVDAFTRHNFNNAGEIAELKEIFTMCDREKLAAAGDPIPAGESFTLFRGCGLYKGEWDIKAWSWTGNDEVAEQFAERYDGMVFTEEDFPRKGVLFYSNVRNEDEYVIDPEFLLV